MTPPSYLESITDHYSRKHLTDRIRTSFKKAGKDFESLSRDDLTVFDEFHIRGRKATRDLAKIADLREGIRLLDIGCGVGGPSRTLAAEWGCRVTGLDIIEEYCRAAHTLTTTTRLSQKAVYVNGDAAVLPFAGGVFDRVWIQHVTMNIENKKRLFEDIRRVLNPKGRLAVFEVCAGINTPPIYPVPWAGDSTINFLAPPDEFHRMINEAGFEASIWDDVSKASLDWFRKASAKAAQRVSEKKPPPGIGLLMGNTAARKMANMVRNLAEDRIRIVRGIFTPNAA
jgi:ubiquinone/menaquinone biosynthesis C-methylase UbiE